MESEEHLSQGKSARANVGFFCCVAHDLWTRVALIVGGGAGGCVVSERAIADLTLLNGASFGLVCQGAAPGVRQEADVKGPCA